MSDTLALLSGLLCRFGVCDGGGGVDYGSDVGCIIGGNGGGGGGGG